MRIISISLQKILNNQPHYNFSLLHKSFLRFPWPASNLQIHRRLHRFYILLHSHHRNYNKSPRWEICSKKVITNYKIINCHSSSLHGRSHLWSCNCISCIGFFCKHRCCLWGNSILKISPNNDINSQKQYFQVISLDIWVHLSIFIFNQAYGNSLVHYCPYIRYYRLPSS